ncbi:MAG: AAA family ATPase [Desulfobacterales bacterium]|nr:AAA family ATPase [Desulfobacterales bacterium]
MEYYKLLQLKREPFSNSPDPEYFFLSSRHQECLQKLELAVRLKRGLNVVIGEVGTGKTTLCRELIRKFAAEPDIETHLILDPSFSSVDEFLRLLYSMLHAKEASLGMSVMLMKEQIQGALLAKGVDQQRTVVLILDEGQKISSACIEILRELLNFETNQFKLLQIVIFAQLEFKAILLTQANFADRINLLHHLAPMDFKDTRRMIHHRLKLSSTTAKPKEMYTWPALWAIYRSTQGYPRKIIHLCHQSMLTMLIQNRTRAGWALIRSCKQRLIQKQNAWPRRMFVGGALIVAILLLVAFLPQYLSHESDFTLAPLFKIQSPSQADIVPDGQPQPAQNTAQITPLPTVAAPPPAGEIQSDAASHAAADTFTPPATIPTTEAPVASIVASEPTPASAVTAEPPMMLGELAVRSGDTLIHLVRLVYGTAENRCMHSVIAVNPQIQNPDAIDLKDVVVFPLMIFQWDAGDLKKHRLVRLFCYWTPGEGSRFQLALATQFDTLPGAEETLAGLPKNLAAKASIRSGWPDGTLLLSKPLMERAIENRHNG